MVGEFQEGWGGRERMIKSCPQMASGPPALLLFGTSDSTPDLVYVSMVSSTQLANVPSLTCMQANLPNLRRLFVEARTEAEENEYSRTAVCHP